MKKTSSASGCSRSKPPPVRNYLNAKSRPLGAPFLSPTHHASDRRVSMSEKAEGVESIAALRNSPKEVTDCMSSWLSFMQMLRGVCTSGAQLSGTLGQLACQSSACRQRASQLQLMWQQLSQATAAATALVQRHTVAALQEVQLVQPPGEVDADQADINQQVVCSGLLTMINLQYQLSAACCECLSQLAECRCFPPHLSATADCNDAVARCFAAKLQPLQPLQPPQRRWSEAAAAAEGGGESEAAALRRWSMPWKLALPTTGAERSRSTTPETVWHTALASQEELQDVISLLAAKPPPPGGPSTHNLPGVTLTKATGGGPCIGGAVSDSCHGSEAIPRPSFSFSHRGSWWGGGTDGDELDIGTLASRKSSSSTDSSSCYSIHSRSSGSASEELTHGQRSHLYSMWSGSDLPFIKLPESSENTES